MEQAQSPAIFKRKEFKTAKLIAAF